MKLREIAIAVAALSMAGAAVAAGDYSKDQQAGASATPQAGTSMNAPSQPKARPSGAASGQASDASSKSSGQPAGMSKSTDQHADASTVREAQQKLSQKGHSPGPVDGILGPRTGKALRDYQQAQGLSASGQLDQQTLASLGVQGEASSGSSPDASASATPSTAAATTSGGTPSGSTDASTSSSTATSAETSASPSK